MTKTGFIKAASSWSQVQRRFGGCRADLSVNIDSDTSTFMAHLPSQPKGKFLFRES
jgi:hypothetical protein